MEKTSPVTVVKARTGTKLLTWEQVAGWQRDNEFILTGYRQASDSFQMSIESIFRVHNETANIWSHLLGMLFFLGGLAVFHAGLESAYPALPITNALAVEAYYACVVVCFLLSTFFHTFSDHSQHLHRIGNELDHLGIVLVMWGSGVSSAFFGFYCNTTLRNAYILAITTTAIGCGIFTLQPRFRQPTYRTMRFFMYVFLGSSLFAPCVHGLKIYGWRSLNNMMSLDHFIGLAIINFSGAAIYAARIPERWVPKRFDLLGQSHNLMHVLVFTGAVVRLRGLLLTLGHWNEQVSKDMACR